MKDFTLVALLKLVIKRFWIIFLVSLFAAGLTFGYFQFLVQPTYMSTGKIIVSNGGINDENEETADTIKNTDLSSSFGLIPTYVGILRTDEPYKRVAATSGCGYTADQLKGKITISIPSDSELFIDVAVTDSDPEKAKIIANSFIEVGSEDMLEMLPKGYAKPLQYAKTGYHNYPQPIKFAILAFIGAAAFVIFILVIVSMFDRSIKNEEDFKTSYKYPVLGVVPDYADAAKGDK